MKLTVLGPASVGPPLPLPFFLSLAECGFPSPADDYVDRVLDLNELVVKNPPATYFVRASGNSMTGAGIFDGDVLVVDRSREPDNGDIVIAALGGELTVKRIRVKRWRGGKVEAVWLIPEADAYQPIEVTEEMDFEVWGVVTHVLHQLARDVPRSDRGDARSDAGRDASGDGHPGYVPRFDA